MNVYNSGLFLSGCDRYDHATMKPNKELMNPCEDAMCAENVQSKSDTSTSLIQNNRALVAGALNASSIKLNRHLSPRIHLNASPAEPNGAPEPIPSEEKRIIKVLISETTIPGFLDVFLSIIHRRRGEFGNVMFSVVSVHDPGRFNHALVCNHDLTFVEDKFLLELVSVKFETRSNVVLLATVPEIDKLSGIAEQRLIDNGFDMTDRVDLQVKNEDLLEAHVISILLKRISIDV